MKAYCPTCGGELYVSPRTAMLQHIYEQCALPSKHQFVPDPARPRWCVICSRVEEVHEPQVR
jgi:hypothetical protein